VLRDAVSTLTRYNLSEQSAQ